MTTAPTVLILPGFDNSGPGHWQTLWQNAHPEYRRVQQRSWTEPTRDEWVAALDDAVVAASGPVVLVGHSLGSITIAHHARQHAQRARSVRGALLVAPANVEDPLFPEAVKSFRPIPRERLPFPSVVVSSSDDWFVDPDTARGFAAAWGSRFVLLEKGGHINTDAGFGPWPEGERLLADLIGYDPSHPRQGGDP